MALALRSTLAHCSCAYAPFSHIINPVYLHIRVCIFIHIYVCTYACQLISFRFIFSLALTLTGVLRRSFSFVLGNLRRCACEYVYVRVWCGRFLAFVGVTLLVSANFYSYKCYPLFTVLSFRFDGWSCIGCCRCRFLITVFLMRVVIYLSQHKVHDLCAR